MSAKWRLSIRLAKAELLCMNLAGGPLINSCTHIAHWLCGLAYMRATREAKKAKDLAMLEEVENEGVSEAR